MLYLKGQNTLIKLIENVWEGKIQHEGEQEGERDSDCVYAYYSQ